LPDGADQLSQGDSMKVVITLVHSMAMERDFQFDIREGERVVGTATVLELQD
jgi:translation elongation factor EF-Tu-like GTPase